MCCQFFWCLCCGLFRFALVFAFYVFQVFLLSIAFLRTVFCRSIVPLEVMITRRCLLENECWAYCSASSLRASGQIFVSCGFHSSQYSVLGIVLRITIRNIQHPKQEGWNRMIFEVHSNTRQSMILYNSVLL